jgi:hypothetical protein
LKIFSEKLRLFKLIWGFYKNKEAFWRHFQEKLGFCLEIWGFYKVFNSFWRLFLEKLRIARFFKCILNRIKAFLKW